MANEAFNIALGRFVHYCSVVGTGNARLIVVPIETTGLEADGTLNNYDDLGALLAASNNEQTTMGRKTVASATITIDDTNDWVDVDIADQVWTGATGNAISKLLMTYDSDTTAGTDANIIPMTYHDFTITPDGSDVTAQVAAAGFARAAG